LKLYDKGPFQPPSLPATSRDAWQPPPLCHDSDKEDESHDFYVMTFGEARN
jgi:hypothetical protein